MRCVVKMEMNRLCMYIMPVLHVLFMGEVVDKKSTMKNERRQ